MNTKKFFIIFFLYLFSSHLFSQVGIGTTTIEDDLLLKVSSSDKGVLIPTLSIPNLAAPAPVDSPAYGLLAYNKYVGKKGFNYWDGSKWSTLIDTQNVYSILGLTISYSTSNSSPVTINNTRGALNYQENDLPTTVWTEVPGLSKVITITQANNSVLVLTEGMLQANNTNADITKVLTYAVGIFVDGKLAGVRNYSFKYGNTYQYDFFSINTLLQGLSAGTHTIKTYVTTRVNDNSSATSWKFGGPYDTASMSNDMSRMNMFIKVTEKS